MAPRQRFSAPELVISAPEDVGSVGLWARLGACLILRGQINLYLSLARPGLMWRAAWPISPLATSWLQRHLELLCSR